MATSNKGFFEESDKSAVPQRPSREEANEGEEDGDEEAGKRSGQSLRRKVK